MGAEVLAMCVLLGNDETGRTIAALTEPQELRAADGRLVGRFLPATEGEGDKMSIPESGLTDAELLAIVNDPNTKWYTPEQVMARLREIDQCSH
jgi:hypothetical protein